MASSVPPNPGQMVVVRNRPAIARDVDASSSRATAAVHAVYVEYLDGWLNPEADQVIWEREAGARVISSLTLPKIGEGSFHPDTPDRLHAFLDAYRWSAINTLHPQREKDSDEIRLVAPWHSAVQVYQADPFGRFAVEAQLVEGMSIQLHIGGDLRAAAS